MQDTSTSDSTTAQQLAQETTPGMNFDVVIVGGGAGGLELAARLGRELGTAGRGKLLLVDRAALHIWKPTLHEIAAGTMDLNQEGLSYLMVARRNHFSFALGELTGLDTAAQQITLAAIHDDDDGQVVVPERRLGYRWLVLATGSGSNFFNTPGAEHAFTLESALDAERFRRQLLVAFTRAAYAQSKRFELAIVGGGATGVELSAEMREAHAEALASVGPEFRFGLGITIVEAAGRILSNLPQHVSDQAAQTLRDKDIRLLTNTRVDEIRPAQLVTSAGNVAADLTVWAAGIKAPDANAGLGLEVNDKNQFIVCDRLRTSAPGVYAMGDCAACAWKGGRLVPARAQAAHQQADFLVGVLRGLLTGKPGDARFEYRDFGSLVSLGENRGVGNLLGAVSGRNYFVGGLLAKWMYMSLHLMHHRAVLGIAGTAVMALARLLQRRVSGRVKLH